MTDLRDQYHADYRAAHRQEILAWRKANKESIAAKKKIYNEANKEIIAAKRKAYNELNKERNADYRKRYYEANRKFINERNSISQKKNRVARLRIVARRRAQRLNNGFEIYTLEQVFALYGTNCHLCNESIDLEAPRWQGESGWERGLHIDHVTPISRGGADNLANVRPAHGKCNLKKGAKTK